MSRGVDWIFWTSGVVVAVAGLALLLWSLFADRPRGRRRCPKCWYDLSGTQRLTCSECGHVARRESALHRTRRHRRWAIVGLLLVAVGYEIAVTPRIQRLWPYDIWRGRIPTTALLAVQPWLDDSLAGSLKARIQFSWAWQQAWYARNWESRYRGAQGKARGEALEAMAWVGVEAQRCLPTVFAAIATFPIARAAFMRTTGSWSRAATARTAYPCF